MYRVQQVKQGTFWATVLPPFECVHRAIDAALDLPDSRVVNETKVVWKDPDFR